MDFMVANDTNGKTQGERRTGAQVGTAFSVDRMSGEELMVRGIAQRDPVPARLVEWYEDTSLVYAVRSDVRLSPVKIGFCNAWGLDERLKSLQTGNPHRLRVIAHAAGYLSSEQRAHHALRAYRLTGEWFRWSRPVAAFVKAMKTRGIEYAIASAKAREDRL